MIKAMNGIETITNFSTFCDALRKVGFTQGGSDNTVCSLARYFDPCIQWHTGDADTDPWEWRIRAVTECEGLAYGKVFFKKSGWITKEWYPYFLAVRRQGKTFDELYADGHVTHMEKRIYDAIRENIRLPYFEIRERMSCSKEDRARFDSALTKLQSKLLITICDKAYKLSKTGEPYGWACTVFCTIEDFLGGNCLEDSYKINPDKAFSKIMDHILVINPKVDAKLASKFIKG